MNEKYYNASEPVIIVSMWTYKNEAIMKGMRWLKNNN